MFSGRQRFVVSCFSGNDDVATLCEMTVTQKRMERSS